MIALFQYSLGVSVSLLLLWAAYRAALFSTNRPRTDRITLLALYCVSLVIFPLTALFLSLSPATGTIIRITRIDSVVDSVIIPAATVWAIGAALCAAFTIVEFVRVALVLRRCDVRVAGGCKVYVHPDRRMAPFCIGRRIVVGSGDLDETDYAILHERGHIAHRHFADMLLAQAVAVLCWYNPVAWLMRRDLRIVHEFQADDYVLRSGRDPRQYQLFLIGKASGCRFPFMANHLVYSDLRRRISAMNSGAAAKNAEIWRYVFPLTAIVLTFTLLSSPAFHRTPVAHAGVDGMEIYVDGAPVPESGINDIPVSQIKTITVNKKNGRIEIDIKQL